MNTGAGWKWQLEDGSFAASQSVVIGDATYRFNADGIMVTGWEQQDGKWSHYSSYGARTNGWLQENGSWYYFGTDGQIRTGWQMIDGRWYYFARSGAWI